MKHRPWRSLGIGGFLACWALAGGRPVPLFGPGVPALPVLVDPGAEPDELRAAAELARVLGLVSGRDWPVAVRGAGLRDGIVVRASRAAGGSPVLRVARDPLAPGPGEVGPDAFRVSAAEGQVTIVGATPEACFFAASWFLQRVAGVRWYCPGPGGEVVPQREELTVPEEDHLVEPAYYSRELTGLDDEEGREWAEHNGLRRRLNFSHALERSFPPALATRHPEWFPLIGGQRYLPASPSDPNWQPNLALPEVATHAAEAALAGYAKHPTELSYSLGINDSVRYDQSDATRSMLDPLRYYRGMPDYSPLVFTFMNRAAGAVSAVRSDRYLGCLAYFWCQDAPAFAVSPRVIPYLAADRSQYYDPGFRRDDQDLFARWGASGVRAFGLWDYAYGEGFVVPREPIGFLASAIADGWKRGARGYLAEIGRDAGFDTFKAWALARLLWQPDCPVDTLEEDFYRGYFRAAAVPVRQFFDLCAQQWASQAGPAAWLKYYQQTDQARLFPPAVYRRLEALLVTAEAAAAPDSASAARVAVVRRAFARMAAFLEFDRARRVVGSLASRPETGRDAGATAAALEGLAGARTQVESCVPAVPARLIRDDPAGGLLLTAALRTGGAVGPLLQLAGPATQACRPWRAMQAALDAGLMRQPNRLRNSTFQEVDAGGQWPRFLFPRLGVLPAQWTLRAVATEDGMIRLEPEERVGATEGRALRIEGAWDTQLYQWMPTQPGVLLLASARLRGATSPGSDAGLLLTFLSNSGEVVMASSAGLPGGRSQAWVWAALAATAPFRAAWVGIGIASSRQQPGDWMEARSVELRSGRIPAGP